MKRWLKSNILLLSFKQFVFELEAQMSRGEKELDYSLLTDAERLNRNGIYEDKTYKRIRPRNFVAELTPPVVLL